MTHKTSFCWHLVAKQGEAWREVVVNFADEVPLLHGFLTCRKILRHGADGFTSPPKEVVLWMYMTPKNQSLSAGFEPANLGSNGKHDNHYTTEDDSIVVLYE
jgi:hypothetical protein